jgi:hypothetical protein
LIELLYGLVDLLGAGVLLLGRSADLRQAMRVLLALRPTMAMLAPSAARACPAARPMPLVAPVTKTCLPCMAQTSKR